MAIMGSRKRRRYVQARDAKVVLDATLDGKRELPAQMPRRSVSDMPGGTVALR